MPLCCRLTLAERISPAIWKWWWWEMIVTVECWKERQKHFWLCHLTRDHRHAERDLLKAEAGNWKMQMRVFCWSKSCNCHGWLVNIHAMWVENELMTFKFLNKWPYAITMRTITKKKSLNPTLILRGWERDTYNYINRSVTHHEIFEKIEWQSLKDFS